MNAQEHAQKASEWADIAEERHRIRANTLFIEQAAMMATMHATVASALKDNQTPVGVTGYES